MAVMFGVEDIFKLGIGPSSSHTLGPMLAMRNFVRQLQRNHILSDVQRIQIRLHGSLSATGRGHYTDRAVLAGLQGCDAETIDPQVFAKVLQTVKRQQSIQLLQSSPDSVTIAFDVEKDLIFDPSFLEYHPNALTVTAFGEKQQNLSSETYFSIGGGHIECLSQLNSPQAVSSGQPYPYFFSNAEQLLEICEHNNLEIWQVVMANECSQKSQSEVLSYTKKIWNAMYDSIERGLHNEGVLGGGLSVRRRAKGIYQQIIQKQTNLITSSAGAFDWLNVYAMAVNEENASGNAIVTAPTNGAAGIVPAVLAYCVKQLQITAPEKTVNFLLTATAIAHLCKRNASISGAEVGCQGEVGSACAMAAAGMAYILGCKAKQIENAAEIALEHNLGLTCDPIAGLVQVPCIERNALAAVKAVNAANLAYRGDGKHLVSLDKVIKTMYETGKDMQSKYKETSKGGLAVNWTEC